MIAFRHNLSACLGGELRYLVQERLHLERIRLGKQVDENGTARRNFASVEGLDAIVPNEIGKVVSAVETHTAS